MACELCDRENEFFICDAGCCRGIHFTSCDPSFSEKPVDKVFCPMCSNLTSDKGVTSGRGRLQATRGSYKGGLQATRGDYLARGAHYKRQGGLQATRKDYQGQKSVIRSVGESELS